MSLQIRFNDLITQFGIDIGNLNKSIGVLNDLTSTSKFSLVLALNSIEEDLAQIPANIPVIDDTAPYEDALYSSNKILALIASTKSSIVDNAPETADTLAEIAALLAANDSAISNLLSMIPTKVDYSQEQDLTVSQELTANTNIGVGDHTLSQEEAYLVASDINVVVNPGYVRPGYFAN